MPPATWRTRAVVLSLCALLPAAASADAATVSRTFAPTGSFQTFEVPGGVTSLTVVAVGGRGGSGGHADAAGGFGARVEGTLATTPGQELWIAVGGNGVDTGCPASPGGWNGGGTGGSGFCNVRGGAGGGASDVRLCAPGDACAGDDPLGRLLVAAGGGGGSFYNVSSPGLAAAGGDAAAPGGSTTGSRGTAGGGGAGTQTGGGAAGPHGDAGFPPAPATAGALAAGGVGGAPVIGGGASGGGGGGGRYGGGGGGSANYYGGGGGGGSNLVPPGGSAAVDASGRPRVTITWEAGPPATVDRPTVAAPAIYADDAASTTVTVVVRDADGAPTNGAEVRFAASGAGLRFGPTTDNGDGTYSATASSAGARGTTTITASLVAPGATSDGVALAQVDRPRVTTPVDGAAVVDPASGAAAIAVSGSADPFTPTVDVGCVTADGFVALAEAVTASAGAWSAEDLRLPDPADDVQCRLVAVPAGFDRDDVDDSAGPRLRRLAVERFDEQPWRFRARAGGFGADVQVRPLGGGCGLTLRAVGEWQQKGEQWLTCGANLAYGSPDGDASFTIDGRPALTPALAAQAAGWENAPAGAVDAAVAPDGALVVTERAEATRCTATDRLPDPEDDEECGELADTGVEVTVRTRIAPSGTHVTQTVLFASTDGRAHDVRMRLATATGYDDAELRLGADGAWTRYDEPYQGAVPAGSDRWSVLVRGTRAAGGPALAAALAAPAVPALAISSGPAPSEQLAMHGAFAQLHERSVPADGKPTGIGMTVDQAGLGEIDAIAAASRDAFADVTIAAPAAGTTTGAQTATVSGTAVGAGEPVDLRVGGQPVAVDADGQWSATVPLAVGENTIEAVVTSVLGLRETASVSIVRLPQAPPEQPPGGGEDPQPGEPPTARPPVANPARLVSRLTAPRRVRLAQARRRGIGVTVTLGAGRTRVTAELRGPRGLFARTVRPQARRGRLTLRVKPSRRAAAKLQTLLKRRKAITLRLRVVARDASGRAQTVTRTIRLVR